ncbi:MAG: OmpA family protein [Gammaproteobacteria bacterium]|jgi:OOP family OmpA-OmpF porin
MRYSILLAAALALLIPLSTHAAITSMRGPLFGSADEAKTRADAVNAETLAPISYSEAVDNYERADDTFRRAGNVDTIRRYLTRAEAEFNKSVEAAETAASALNTTIQARKDALAAEAPSYAEDDWFDAEQDFSNATRRLESGSIKYAQRYATEAEENYRAAELVAIKANYLNETRQLIEQAEKLRADRYAPKSFGNAQHLLDTAEKKLNENRYDTDEPRSLAADAKHNALHAIYVAKLDKMIRDRFTSLEEVLLEWEASIARLGDVMDTPVYFDHGEDAAIETLLAALEAREAQLTRLTQQLQDRDDELTAMREQNVRMESLVGGGNQQIAKLETMLADHQNRLDEQARQRERFTTVESLFQPNQAMVLRQGDTVIIRLIGLTFDSGAATLKPEHMALLKTLERAIREFPESRIVVEGHTDAFGSDLENLNLSQARADSVVRHLLASLPLSPASVQAMGYGETRPVANNETEEGRKRNRRIDVVIKPSQLVATNVARAQLPDIELNPSR